ncbi:unnamed protein product, partial [Scytosiphon promiscuus]
MHLVHPKNVAVLLLAHSHKPVILWFQNFIIYFSLPYFEVVAVVRGAELKRVIVIVIVVMPDIVSHTRANDLRHNPEQDPYDFEAPYPEIRDAWIKAIKAAVSDMT